MVFEIFVKVIFAIITIFKSSLLGPLNNLWIKLGLIIGYILTLITLGIYGFWFANTLQKFMIENTEFVD